ncbi:hypothetical protein Pint_21542 [Pistacia integerrima]|uniref:Uncharacterized protein n=1 Tax=Pistacia integerrima TaxID=434235 RepID=A0ACC0X9Z5_9ROSI|nr:hypothetical protein Pint_21542 [Pistacia integerrima]
METRRRNSAPASLEHTIVDVAPLEQNMNQIDTSAGSGPSSRSEQVMNSETSPRTDSLYSSENMNMIKWPPIVDLLSERRDNHRLLLALRKAALEGNVAEDIIGLMRHNRKLLRAAITEEHETVIHLAAGAKQTQFVEEAIKLIEEEQKDYLKFQNKKCNTAFCYAAMAGSKEIAQAMLKKDQSLLTIRGGLALKLLEDDQENELAGASYKVGETTMTALHRLAQTPLHLLDQTIKDEETGLDLSDQAVKLVENLWEKILKKDENERTIFHIAIIHRHTNVFDQIYEIGFNKQIVASYKDFEENSILHLAAKYPDTKQASSVPGAAFEMQQELIIFKEVELLVQPSHREMKNRKDQTPRELFTIEHANLLRKGEEWMRNTATQCMLVATIIATVVFAAIFSVPGGNNDEAGIPTHWRSAVFRMFAVKRVPLIITTSVGVWALNSLHIYSNHDASFRLKLFLGL